MIALQKGPRPLLRLTALTALGVIGFITLVACGGEDGGATETPVGATETLVGAGAKIDAKLSGTGRTPLQIAAQEGRFPIMQGRLLL